MQILTITETTYARMQRLAVPLKDTDETLTLKLVECYERHCQPRAAGKPLAPAAEPGVRDFNPEAPPNLKHAVVIEAVVDGKTLPRHANTWKAVLLHLIVRGAKTMPRVELKAAIRARIMDGEVGEKGYAYVPEARISVQGQEANRAWRASVGMARKLGVPVMVRFAWPHREGAAHPGQVGRFVIG